MKTVVCFKNLPPLFQLFSSMTKYDISVKKVMLHFSGRSYKNRNNAFYKIPKFRSVQHYTTDNVELLAGSLVKQLTKIKCQKIVHANCFSTFNCYLNKLKFAPVDTSIYLVTIKMCDPFIIFTPLIYANSISFVNKNIRLILPLLIIAHHLKFMPP